MFDYQYILIDEVIKDYYEYKKVNLDILMIK